MGIISLINKGACMSSVCMAQVYSILHVKEDLLITI